MIPRTSLVAVCYSRASVSSQHSRLHRLERPRVLDGEHGLVGEGLSQLDLLCREGTLLQAEQIHKPDQKSVAERRN